MVRSLVYLLLFIVIFLSGMLLGIDRERTTVQDKSEEWITNDAGYEQYVSLTDQTNPSIGDINKQENLTQRTALLIESGVKGFYNMIVEILYQVSTLFF